MKSVKRADRPDSVQRDILSNAHRDRHSSGLRIAAGLGATYPHTPRAGSTCAYLVLLRAEIARFTQPLRLRLKSRRACALPTHAPKNAAPLGTGPWRTACADRRPWRLTRLCCSDPHLAVESC